jgi:hypothetical protein
MSLKGPDMWMLLCLACFKIKHDYLNKVRNNI